jgi:hypothetical protein
MNRLMEWRVFVQRQVSPNHVVIRGISFEDAAEVSLAEYDDVVETLPSDRANQPFEYAFCHGDRGAVGRSRMPMLLGRPVKT